MVHEGWYTFQCRFLVHYSMSRDTSSPHSLKFNLDDIAHPDLDLFPTVLFRENDGITFFHHTPTENGAGTEACHHIE